MINFFKNLFSKFKSNFTEGEELHAQEQLDLNSVKIKYYLNDPTTPELMGLAINPATYKLNFNVKYYTGNGGPLDRSAGQAANTYAVLCHSINYLNRRAELNKWALVQMLNVDPLAGVQANAFYDRQNLKFFYFNNKQNQKIFTCLSADIVTHELGHALLDGMRPEFFNMASAEIWAFHESFGDIMAILSMLAQPLVVKDMLAKTGGDLRKPNIVEGLAEQFGIGLGLGGALRKGLNNFLYTDPKNLPKNAPNDQLASEPHSFSRVMTGAFYQCFVKAYEMFGKNEAAVNQARDLLAETFILACKKAPASANFMPVFCKTWVEVMKMKSPSIAEQMTNIFISRNLMSKMLGAQSALYYEKKFDVNKTLLNESKTEDQLVVINKGEAMASDLLGDVVFASSTNEYLDEIMQLKVSLPCDEALYNDDGEWMQMCATENEACESAKCCLIDIIENNMYGPEEDKQWYKDDSNSLVRKFISCCGDNGFTNNCLVPGNPEFGKCWKCKNNTGCCTYGSCGCAQKPQPKIISSCACRYNSCTGTRYNGSCGTARYNSNLCNSQNT
jgi:hypothetical protein